MIRIDNLVISFSGMPISIDSKPHAIGEELHDNSI
jgi:hypothetical protein